MRCLRAVCALVMLAVGCGDVASAAVVDVPFDVAVVQSGPGPRVRPGIPEGVTLTTEHPGGDLTPGLYDRVRFADDVFVPCGTLIVRSALPAFHSTCDRHALRPAVAFSAVGGTDRCYGGAAFDRGHYVAWADTLDGSSDGIRLDGGDVSAADNRIRVYSCSPADHDDGVQAYATDGDTLMELEHNDIDARPVNAPNESGNAAIFAADNSTGRLLVDGNVLSGGGYTLRLHPQMRYVVTGNVVTVSTYLYGPTYVTGTIDEWSNNRLSDGTPLEP